MLEDRNGKKHYFGIEETGFRYLNLNIYDTSGEPRNKDERLK